MTIKSDNVPATRGPGGQVSPYVRGMDPTKDFIPPTYRLLQGQSAAVGEGLGNVGQFFSPELGEARDEIRAAILLIQKTRILWTEGDLGAPRCSSDDGINPRPGGEFEAYACVDCPEYEKACLAGYGILAYDLDREHVFAYRANSVTSLRPVRNLLTAIHASHGGIPFAVATTFKSTIQKNRAQQSFAVPVLLMGGELDEDEFVAVKALADRFADVTITDLATEAPKEETPEKPKRAPRKAAAKAAAKGGDALY